MQINITKVEIKNFRNITEKTIEFGERTLILGKNHIGKTNIIEAIYFCLTGKLLNGGDVSSIKPLEDTKKIVDIKVYLIKKGENDEFTFERRYFEKWQTARGSTTATLVGHAQSFNVNGFECMTEAKAKEILFNYLGILNPRKDIDYLALCINPNYLMEQYDKKLFRKLIIELTGVDLSLENIKKMYPAFALIEENYKMAKGDTSLMNTNINKQIKLTDSEIVKLEGALDYINKTLQQYEAFDIQAIENELIQNRKDRESLTKDENLQIEYKKIITERDELNKEFETEKSNYYAKQKNAYAELRNLQETANNLYREILKTQSIEKDNETYKNAIVELQAKLVDLNEQKAKLEDVETFTKENGNECPNCHFILNKEAVERERTKRLDKVLYEISKVKAMAQNNQDAINNFNNAHHINSIELKENYDKSLKEIEDFKLSHEKEFNGNDYEPSAILLTKKKEYSKKIQVYKEKAEKLKQASLSIAMNLDKRYNELLSQKATYNLFKEKQKDKLTITEKLENTRRLKAKQEQMSVALKGFKTFLNDYTEPKLKNLFGDLNFVLIEQNIKEGSTKDVCYPCIYGSNSVPYENGSSSEKIITGVKVLESIRNKMLLPILPIIFDECEKFDTDNFDKTFEKVNAQIITAKVDDRYSIPTPFIITKEN